MTPTRAAGSLTPEQLDILRHMLGINDLLLCESQRYGITRTQTDGQGRTIYDRCPLRVVPLHR